jgi:diaminohydroxyphosphoribosylaminopyrimidine deaminase/5-amino-6-(5-phosphoribosylamino)uracil reductase
LKDLLQHLGRRGLMTVLVEGGGQIHGTLLRESLADQATIYVTPRLIGGDGVPLIAGRGRATIAAAALQGAHWTALGDDMLLEALF